MGRAFVDTNVIVYANDVADEPRHSIAKDLTSTLALDENGVISTQVLQEYASCALNKLRQPPAEAAEQIAFYARSMKVVQVTPELIGRAITLHGEHKINYWDACIIAAAESAGCSELYSEDLNAGQSYSGVRVVNPFA